MQKVFNKESITESLESYLINVFQHLHQYPELSNQESKTQEFLQKELEQLNIPYKKMGNTGLCAEIEGKKPGKTILLRADMDALPIVEKTDLSYRSKNHGVMHACGHDAHMTVGLGTAVLLMEKRQEFNGTVKIMFQPCEEVQPGGAIRMIDEGVLENPKVDAAIGIHTNPYLLPGRFEVKKGIMLANSDRIYISLIGKGGHAAAPHQTIDPVAMAGQFIVGVQNIVARQVSPLDQAVITIGKISGGTKSNVIADHVELSGTVRTVNKDTQEFIKAKIESLLKTVTEYWGGSYTYEYKKGNPATFNDSDMVDIVKQSAAKHFCKDSVIELENPYLSGDDFSYLSQAVPSVFIYWGTGSGEKENFPWHHAKFEVNPAGFKYGITLTVQCILDYLESNN